MSRAALLHIALQWSPNRQERWPTASGNPWQFEYDGALSSWLHKGVSYILFRNSGVAGPSPALAHPESASNQDEEHVMIALGLVRMIEQHSDELAPRVDRETGNFLAHLRSAQSPGRGIAARTPGNLAAPWRVAAHQDEPRHRETLF